MKLVTLILATAVALVVSMAFSRPIESVLKRIIADEISSAWARYLKFTILVVGISSGVRIHQLERYITPVLNHNNEESFVLQLTTEHWVLEIYRTIIETLEGIAWMLFVFFCFALLAYVFIRIFELRKHSSPVENVKKDAEG
ncbi:MAG: hypothetical protein KIG95_09515 [Comamonas sp.]|nr:hypothetical protein [Comamonas sp.]